MKSIDPSEEQIQKAVATFLSLLERQGRLLFFHVPSEGKHKVQYRVKQALMGCKAGVPDIIVLMPDGFCGFIELKSEKGILSKAQKQFRDTVKPMGFQFQVCRSVNEVEGVIHAWETGKGRIE